MYIIFGRVYGSRTLVFLKFTVNVHVYFSDESLNRGKYRLWILRCKDIKYFEKVMKTKIKGYALNMVASLEQSKINLFLFNQNFIK